jgi:hypothetical protein
VQRLRPAAAGEEKVVVRGASRAGELRRGWGRAVRRWFVVTAAAVLLLSVVVLGVQSRDSLAQADSTCSSQRQVVNYFDESRQPLAHFQVTQSWCWNGRAVTYVSQAKVVGKVTKLGAARGWRYDGLIGKNDYYFAHDGLSRGGHASIRKGTFAVCAKNTQCYQRTPRVQIYVYHDGRSSSLAQE